MKDTYACPQCGQPLTTERGRGVDTAGGWRYHCGTPGCFGEIVGWTRRRIIQNTMGPTDDAIYWGES